MLRIMDTEPVFDDQATVVAVDGTQYLVACRSMDTDYDVRRRGEEFYRVRIVRVVKR